jgi:hypothetical protein
MFMGYIINVSTNSVLDIYGTLKINNMATVRNLI